MIDQVLISKKKWIDFWEYFNGNPAQTAGVEKLYDHLRLASPTLLAENAEWIEMYREQATQPHYDTTQKVPGYVTPNMMSQITGYPPTSFDDLFCNDCNRLFRETGFDQHLSAMQMLMANMAHETCNFIYLKELADGWAYEGRSDLGNTQAGDGPRFKGAGVLQLTGRHNYQRLANDIGDPRVMEGVDYVADTYPFTSAATWIRENDLLNVCLSQGFEACCVRINGGHNGYNDRCTKYAICQRVMQ